MNRWMILLAALLALGRSVSADPMKTLLAESRVRGGVAVHLGCGDGRSTVELYADDKLLIIGLDTDARAVEQAKDRIAKRKLYGQVSAETFDGKNLPFGDQIVNLVIAEDPAEVSADELQRVLAPRGAVFLKSQSRLLHASRLKKEKEVDGWTVYRKPWPADIDEWTHFLYGPGNNAVSRDRRVGAPEHLQWFAGPMHTRDHDALASLSAMTSSDGRVFYIYDEGPVSVIHQPADWKLIARDAFNGKLLWKRNIPTWMTHLYNFRGGPVQLTRRLVSVADHVYVTLGFDAPVVKLNAATGETLMTYAGSEKTEEMIRHKELLLLVTGDPEELIGTSDRLAGYWVRSDETRAASSKQIAAYDAETGKLKWKLDQASLKTLVPLSFCAQGDRVFYLDGKQLHCLNAQDGTEIWASNFETSGRFIRAFAPTVVVEDDVILCMSLTRLFAFAVEDGRKLWERKGTVGFGSPGDLFVINGKAFTLSMQKGIKNLKGENKKSSPYPAKSVVALDIHTGEIAETIPFAANQHHHRCFRNKATESCILIGYSGIQTFDPKSGTTDLNQWVRGLCQYGMMPANGFIYVPPDPCQCYSDVKVNGFLALSSGSSLDGLKVKPVLEKGPAYGAAIPSAPASGWATYRGNAQRSGVASSGLPEKLSTLWDVEIGQTITAPVGAGDAGGRVYVGARDAYTVYSLEAATGKEVWRFMANGPIDSPPTIANGYCVFGSGDGSVYALRANDGALVWRFKVSGLERRIGDEDRLASPWPVHGSVLVLDHTVYFAAGRSSHLDGGIKLYGLNLETGARKHFNELRSSAGKTSGALVDMLAARGDDITMRNAVFDRALRRQGAGRTSLRSLLDDSWFYRSRSIGKNGLLNVRHETGVFRVINPYTGMKKRRTREKQKYNQIGHLHQKYTRYLEKEWFPVGVKIEGPGWQIDEAFQPRAMLMAGEKLYLAGWLDSMNIELKSGRPTKTDGSVKRASELRVYSAKTGQRLAAYPLKGEPVWNGIAAAHGQLFISLKSGAIVCMGE